MKIKFYWIGPTKDKRILSLEDEYLSRIQNFIPAEITAISELKKSDPRSRSSQLAREGKKLLASIPKGARIIALDERGSRFSSRQMAAWMENVTSQGGTNEISFVAGGYWGIPEEILRQADQKISLSRMTFPHELARVLLLEQVFRSFSINRGLPYHK